MIQRPLIVSLSILCLLLHGCTPPDDAAPAGGGAEKSAAPPEKAEAPATPPEEAEPPATPDDQKGDETAVTPDSPKKEEAAPPPAAAPADAPPEPHPGLLDPSQATETAPDVYKARFETSAGDFVVEVYREWAPRGADRFYNLVKIGFFDEARFFRVVPNFVVQIGINGDPRVNAVWRNARIPDDPVAETNAQGTVTFATAGPNSRTTQIFINFKSNAGLDAQGFSPFGKVVEGMDIVGAINPQYGQRPDQMRIQTQGNAYLKAEFPRLDYVKRASIVE
ncbi:MAG: peptidylprolyl isomerase [Planctomycetes bacterium]|nr:peptidylprolyl isomerase [Planctomycetota bacterium]